MAAGCNRNMFQTKKRTILTVIVAALAALIVAVAAFLYFSGLGVLLWFIINFEGETPQPEFAQRLEDSGLVVHTIGGSRPATLVLPTGQDSQKPLPLLLALHGFSGYASMMDDFFEIPRRVNTKRFALILADGTPDDDGNRFWNATDLCCGRTETKPDDVAYLSALVEEAKAFTAIDRTYSMGYSNGGFMSYRLACESLPGLAGIASVAGSSFDDSARCDGATPVSVLQVHGDEDEVIKIDSARCDGATPVSVLQVHGDEDEVIKIDGGANSDLGPGSPRRVRVGGPLGPAGGLRYASGVPASNWCQPVWKRHGHDRHALPRRLPGWRDHRVLDCRRCQPHYHSQGRLHRPGPRLAVCPGRRCLDR